ncbi:membrane protein [Streptomyces aureus]|uniref:membrane protein n=1 Tax=Streptomyces aureus TaxID=193461 RepID=UPI00056237B9|nr:membrane protein [Streptomyces aureus]
MSRETDSSSSGPNGRGGAAYPSGTPPYGTPAVSENGADAGRSAAGKPTEERKTETTLTTRIRINIPGSRPIPPVVVRTPVADADAASEGDDAAGAGTQAPPSAPAGPTAAAPAPSAPAEQPAPAEDKTSDWFAPRKPGTPPKGAAGGGSTNGAGVAGGSAPAGSAGAAAATPSAGTPGTGRPAPSTGAGPLGITGGVRPGGPNPAALPGATGAGPVAPGHGGGTGSFDVSKALRDTGSFPAIGSPAPSGGNGGSGASGPAPSGEPSRDDLPYFSESGRGGPAGPTGGPATGDGPLRPPTGAGAAPGSLAAPSGPAGGGRNTGRGYPAAGTGTRGGLSGGLSDDTAILTPQKPAPDPGPGGYGTPAENVSGHTLTSGMPVVSPSHNFAFDGEPGDGPRPHTPPKLPEPVRQPAAPAQAKPAKKKGRNKPALLAVLVVVLAGGAYGAGLLMNHSDVPKGTTVLGVDIGGGTRDDAVKKLDAAFGDRTNKALTLSVDGDNVKLRPDQAGLQLDDQATVRAAAGSDYNPISVIGSLFGQERVVDPVMPVDKEKLQAALERAASGSGSASDGTIKFGPGKAVAVYGKEGKGIDVASSLQAVQDAYRAQVETGSSTPVKVATTTRQPTVSKAEVDRKMSTFASVAMSANITVQTDAAHSVSFSPQKSIWKFLSVQPVQGKLVEHYDLSALEALYGHAFDGVTITKGDGSQKAVSPQDVASAVGRALVGKTAAARIITISTNPS